MKTHILPSSLVTVLFTFSLISMALCSSGLSQDLIQTKLTILEQPEPTTPDTPLVVAVEFDVADGYHVYADAERFRINILKHTGLNPDYTASLPEVITITDPFSGFPPKKIEVFEGVQQLQLTFLSLDAPESPWHLVAEIHYQACSDKVCLPPETLEIDLKSDSSSTASSPPVTPDPAPASSSADWQSKGLLLGILAAFVAGLALSLTPCVYPMIGITVAVIGGQHASKSRSLFLTALYVLGLSLTYAAAGVIVASLGASAADFFRSPLVLGVIATIFFLLGLSMFDLFSITTPAALNQRLQKVGGNGSATGVFLMGCLSAFVVGPCVSAPLIGLITYVATTGDKLTGFLFFFALAWGMGVILFLAGAASNLLPRAGVWMVRVKHLIGVVILWAAVYFARPVIGELWFFAASLAFIPAAIAAAGAFQLPDPADNKRDTQRKVLIFLIALLAVATASSIILTHVGADDALGLNTDYTVNLNEELAVGKPVLLDFWAPWCTICKEIERDVLNDPELQDELDNLNLVKVHFDHNDDLKKRFDLIGPPAFVVLTPNNEQISPVMVGKEELRRYLENKAWEKAMPSGQNQ